MGELIETKKVTMSVTFDHNDEAISCTGPVVKALSVRASCIGAKSMRLQLLIKSSSVIQNVA